MALRVTLYRSETSPWGEAHALRWLAGELGPLLQSTPQKIICWRCFDARLNADDVRMEESRKTWVLRVFLAPAWLFAG
jgi:hypothetical protein